MIWQRIRPTYLGGLLLVCLVLGGGTQKGLPTVYTLELMALPLALDLAISRPKPSFGWPIHVFVALLGLCFAIQFVPAGSAFLTGDPGRTVDSFVYVAFTLTLFYSFGRLDPMERNRMVAWFLTGVILNGALGLTQFAASRGVDLKLFPYSLGAGFFANENHFSSLLYIAIPFVIYQFDAIGKLPLALVALLVVVFIEFAAGSTAGIVLSIACALVSTAVIVRINRVVRAALLSLSAVVAIGSIFLLGNVMNLSPDDPLDRPAIALTTIDAIGRNLPFGSGYGTFEIVYPSVEADSAISGTFVNHAHNEPLELLVEGGFPAACAVLMYLLLIVVRLPAARQSQLCLAALCSIGFVLAHSLVDYPLRTAALVAVFALLNAIYFSLDMASHTLRRSHGRRRGVEVTVALPRASN